MGKPNHHRHGEKNRHNKNNKHTQPETPEQYKLPKNPPTITKDERGLYNFTESELAADTSIRLLGGNSPEGDAKFANFEEYLKSR